MKTLYLDPFSGVSGNMLLGAMFDLGLDFEQFKSELNKLNLSGYELSLEQTTRSAISGHLFEVRLTDPHHHADESLTAAEVAHHHHHHHGRNLTEIEGIINDSQLKQTVKEGAIAVFNEIAQAEAHVHHLPMTEVHFHEVGAIDSIVDIVGFFIAMDLLQIGGLMSGTLVDGSGTIEVAHGTMPVPVPAVMQMRVNSEVPLRQRDDIQTELVTPTGFAIVKQLAQSFGPIPTDMLVEQVGYGFGTRETGHLNAIRVSLLNSQLSHKEVHTTGDDVVELHANIDDQSGEQLGFALHELMNAGAYDAYFTPIFMKKNRPAYQLTVLTTATMRDQMVQVILKHTSTFGVRWATMQRTTMQRTLTTVETEYGPIHLKIGQYQDLSKVSVEYDDAAKLATSSQVSVNTIVAAALQAFSEK